MADKKISALPAATTPLAGTEVLPIVQSSTTDQVSVANLTAGRNVSMAKAFVGAADDGVSKLIVGGRASATDGTVIQYMAIPNGTEAYIGTGSNHPLNVAINGSTKWTYDTSFNLVPSVAAKGINFTANTPAAGMTSQLLNWYEEGTCSLAVSDGTNSSATQTMKYVRTGRQVTVTVALYAVDVTGLTAGAALRLTGFPFNASGQMNFVLFQPKVGGISAEIPNGNSYAGLYTTNTAQDGAAISVTSLGGPSTMSLFGAAVYQV